MNISHICSTPTVSPEIPLPCPPCRALPAGKAGQMRAGDAGQYPRAMAIGNNYNHETAQKKLVFTPKLHKSLILSAELKMRTPPEFSGWFLIQI
jgi:hypothetical protein